MAQDILITPGSGEPQILFRGSGAIDTAVELNVLSSYQSGTGSGTALLFEGTEGQLFGITDNLSSGTIFSVADITGLPIIEADASGDVKLGEYGRYVGIGTGVPAYGLDVFSSGILRKGVILSNYVPATTTNALYNEGGTLKFNGSSVGGASAESQYASGQAISNQSNITALNTASGIATSLLSVSGTATSLVASSGIATYASGQAVANQSSATTNASNISTNTGNISTNTARVSYASGQAISNQSNITALNTASGIATSLLSVSGTATSLVATSGIATYASGNTANIAFGSNAEGDILYHNGTSFIRLPKGTDNYILKMNGNVPNWEAESGGGSSLTAGSGVVVDGASKINIHGGTGNLQEIQLTSDNIFTPKMIFTGSGVQDTPVTLKVLSSHGAVNTSGTALSFEGTQGQLFGITDNLSSGNIFTVNDITGLPLISASASGDVKLGEYGRYVGVGTGVPLYGFDVSSSGQFQKGFVLSNYVPAVTANTLYNEGGTLKFNSAATYAPLLTASGAAIYASGQVNVSSAGTAVASKALVLDSAKSFTGTKHGVFNEFDSRVTASGVTIGASGITITGGAYVQEAVPANDTPTTEDATITLDLSAGNYHNVVLGANVTKFEFTNAKRGQRFLLRITQHASSAKTIAWTNVDYTTGGAAATVRWAGGGTAPTMSTATSHTDVYGFLCTNNAGSAFDGFVVGQNLPD